VGAPSARWFGREGRINRCKRIRPKAKGRIRQLFVGPIVNHTFCYPGFVGRGGPGQCFGWVGIRVCHSRVDPREASFWPWGITLGSKIPYLPLLSPPDWYTQHLRSHAKMRGQELTHRRARETNPGRRPTRPQAQATDSQLPREDSTAQRRPSAQDRTIRIP
jgi:hypothetical protein